jgi:hypothetical protein
VVGERFTFRELEPRDLAQARRHCAAQNRRDGTSYGVPRIFDAAGKLLADVPLALAEIDSRGRLAAAHIFERTLEYMSFGGGAQELDAVLDEAPGIFYELRRLGYRDLHILPPRRHLAALEAALKDRMGMHRLDDYLAHFYRGL